MISIIKNKIGNHFIFKKYPITKEFIKFCLVGLTNLLIDISVYWFLTRWLNLYYLLAAVGSFVVAVTWSFFINQKWTFRYQGNDLRLKYIKFFVANFISMILSLCLLYVLVDIIGLFDILSKFLVAVVVAFVNFGLNKFWTFR